jgi:serine/threonine-protein phosphatase 2A regulatory subunit B''
MVKPVKENEFRRADLKRSLMAPLFYNILFNLSKFIQAEQRDPIKIKQVHSTPQLT